MRALVETILFDFEDGGSQTLDSLCFQNQISIHVFFNKKPVYKQPSTRHAKI